MDLPDRLNKPAWISKFYESTPWDIKDIEACLSSKKEPLYEKSIEQRFEKHEKLRLSLSSLERKPSYFDPLIYVLRMVEEQGYYSILQKDADGKILLLFTSPHRAVQYAAATGYLDNQPGFVPYSPAEWEEYSGYFINAGLTLIALNKCPYCETFCTVPVSAVNNKDDLIKIWSIDMATKLIRYDYFLDEMRLKMDRRDFTSVKEIGEYAVTHVEAEDPKIHLLLAECGIRQNDSELIDRKTRIIGMFGDKWIKRLDELKSAYHN